MTNRIKQIKYYTKLLKDNEYLLLKSNDEFFNCHYCSSSLAVLTGFLGTEGEAVIDKKGKIRIFVDTRYHLLVDKQVYDDIEVYKMPLGETFFEAFKKFYKKNSIFHVVDDISLKTYLKYSDFYDLRKYTLPKAYSKNLDFNKKQKIFKISDKIDRLTFLDKIKKLKKVYNNIAKVVIFNLDEISYLTGLRSFQMKYSSNFRSVLFLDFKSNNYILFCDKLSKKIKIEGLSIVNLKEFDGFLSSVKGEIGINFDDINLKNYVTIKKPKEIKTKSLATLASIRSTAEIETLQESYKKLDRAIFSFKNRIKTGLSEYELCEIFEEELLKNNAKCPSFKTILALAENSASIHYSTPDKNKILENENIILLDCGGYYENGFATDITRTFYVGNNPKNIHKKIYTNVLKAFLKCYLSDETNAKKLDFMARDYLAKFEKDGFYFNHGLGHGIATSVHQNPPLLSMKSKDIIKPYQVHSIEPGLYGKNKDGIEFGVRIENCVYSDLNFKKNSLSKFPFEEILIDYSLLDKKETDFVKNWNKFYENN